MRGEIVGTEVGFHLDDATDARHAGETMDQAFAEQIASDGNGIAIVECPGQLAQMGSSYFARPTERRTAVNSACCASINRRVSALLR